MTIDEQEQVERCVALVSAELEAMGIVNNRSLAYQVRVTHALPMLSPCSPHDLPMISP